MSHVNELWKPDTTHSTWTCSPVTGSPGSPGRRRPDLVAKMNERRLLSEARGFGIVEHTTKVPHIDKRAMGPKEQGRCTRAPFLWSKNGNKHNACPAWRYDVGAWDEDGSPITWTRKTLYGAPAMIANRNAYLLEVASGHRPQKGFTPGVEPSGTLNDVDPSRTTTEGLADKFTPRNALRRTPGEIHKLRQALRASQQLPPLPDYEPDRAWVDDLSLPTPHEAVGYTVRWSDEGETLPAPTVQDDRDVYESDALYIKGSEVFGQGE